MRAIVVGAVILGLLSGLVGALAYGQLSDEAGAAPPPPSAQAVREQNLDSNGFIRVHEQGTASVTGTVNIGNLPPVQDVNVLSSPADPVGRLIALSMTPFVGGQSSSQPVDVADCSLISIMSRGGRVGPIQKASLDGTYFEEVDVVALGGKRYAPSDSFSNIFNIPTVTPILSAVVNTNTGATNTPEAWIWCEP